MRTVGRRAFFVLCFPQDPGGKCFLFSFLSVSGFSAQAQSGPCLWVCVLDLVLTHPLFSPTALSLTPESFLCCHLAVNGCEVFLALFCRQDL